MSKTMILAAGLAAFTFAAASAPASAQDTMRLMTGPQGGVWVPLAGSLKNIWEKAIPGVTVQTLPGAGIANVRGIDEDKAEIGFGNSISTVDGVNGVAPFPRKTTNVCQMATLYPQYFQIVVNADSGINSVRDFKGKGLAVQTRGNTAEVITRQILEVNGLKYEDMRTSFLPSYTDAASLLKDGQAQVFTLGTTIPASSIMDLATSRDVKLLDLKESLEGHAQAECGLLRHRSAGEHLSQADRAGDQDRLRRASDRLVQAAGGAGACDDEGDARQFPRPRPHQQGDGGRRPQGDGRRHRREVPSRRREILRRAGREGRLLTLRVRRGDPVS
jgi:TRAP transporter TAXI family solute receptor